LLRQSSTFREQISRIALDIVVIMHLTGDNFEDPVSIQLLPGLKEVQFNTDFRNIGSLWAPLNESQMILTRKGLRGFGRSCENMDW
jgi:hypothetical protein